MSAGVQPACSTNGMAGGHVDAPFSFAKSIALGPARPPRSLSLQQGYLLDFVDELVSAASKQWWGHS